MDLNALTSTYILPLNSLASQRLVDLNLIGRILLRFGAVSSLPEASGSKSLAPMVEEQGQGLASQRLVDLNNIAPRN